MSEFDRDALQRETYEHIETMNSAFLAINDLFKAAADEVETKDDVIFLGNGVESVYQLIYQYQSRLDELHRLIKKKYGEMESAEKVDAAFEAAIMASLDKLPLTDMYDVR